MKHVVSFSGGRTSAYLVYLMEQKRISEGLEVEYVFMDTGAEHENTYKFVRDIVSNWNIDLKIIKAKINPERGKGSDYQVLSSNDIGWDLTNWKAYFQKHGMPHAFGSQCTQVLKMTPFKKYCDEHFGKGNYITWLGIRADEPKRLTEKKGIKYLAEISPKSKQEILNWWASQTFDLELDDWMGNCVFCIKKSLSKVAVAAMQEEEKANEWHDAIMSSDLSATQRKSDKREQGKMFRGNMDLIEVRNLYAGKSVNEIVSTMRIKKGCAIEKDESCEVFGCNMDLFEDSQ